MTPDDSELFVAVAQVSDVPPGTFSEIEIEDQVYILSNVDGAYYVVSAWCSHQGTSLALGRLNGPVLICYAHLWRFDVRTGQPVWPALAQVSRGYNLRCFPVRVEGDIIMMRPR